MKNQPQALKVGDKIAITCPAKKLPNGIKDAIDLLVSWGLEVVLGETVTAAHHQFAGDDELRAKDLQGFLDDNSIKAIVAARGGYGTIRMIDKVNFSNFANHPKWLVGFSDITILHTHIFGNYGIESIHGQMPLNIPDASSISLQTLRKALFGEPLSYSYTSSFPNRSGHGEGILIGGNLTLLVMVEGSVSDIDYTDKILFIEDVGEYLYSIDRMLWNMKRSGKLAQLKGLIVGGFSDMKDNDIPFGQTAEELVWELVKEYDYPVCFNFPAGHITDNRALIFGKTLSLNIDEQFVNAHYIT